tara:strand:+ start:322 stop:1266 length:945 start_codon:yes stop_codon:yes gene_type:complete
MEVAFFTEGGYSGKQPRNHPNARTEIAWMIALNANHFNIHSYINQSEKQYDLGILILPKKNLDKLMVGDFMGQMKNLCKKVAIMQEGPNWNWQDYSMEEQIWYFNTLCSVDFLFCHNYSDQKYYEGLTGQTTYVMPSLMIEDSIQTLLNYEQSGVMIGGNMTSWYGGFDSMMVAQEFGERIYAPSMGRKIEREEELDITHLPYMNWQRWICELRKAKYGVHLMRTHAAGTFALNCAYLGIPCIGYEGLDTQESCHPDLTVKVGDLKKARKIAERLRLDEDFYLYCSNLSKTKYKEHFSEEVYKSKIDKILKTEL